MIKVKDTLQALRTKFEHMVDREGLITLSSSSKLVPLDEGQG